MKDLIKEIENLEAKAKEAWKLLDLDIVKTQVKALEGEMTAPDFWSDADHAKKLTKEASDLRSELDTWESFLGDLKDLADLVKMADAEGEEEMRDEISDKLRTYQEKFSKLEFSTLFSGEYDPMNAIVAIHAGSGGTDSQDWAEMLKRMLLRFAEKMGWETQILFESFGSEAGIKTVTFRVIGRYAYGYLRSEYGVHRLVRISPFDAEKMRHTSFALVEVLPEIEEAQEIEIDPKDLRIDTFMSGGHGGQSVNTTYSAVRLVHEPTGITVTCQNERSQQQNKETAMKILKSRLKQLYDAEKEEEKKKLRGEYKSAEWGNQIRSYVLHPYKMVKDLRTGYETSDTQGVLDGNLEPFMEAFLRHELSESDRFEEANRE